MRKDAAATSKAAKKPGAAQETGEIFKTVFYALLIALIIRTVLFQPYTIPSASEEPNLYQGDYIIVSKWSYGYSRHSILFSPPIFKGRIFFRPPTRGDIIVFKLPRDGHTDYIKRLIGMPGDHIQMRAGQLYINGRALPEMPVKTVIAHDHGYPEKVTWVQETNPEGRQYVTQIHGMNEPADNTGIYVVPPRCYFMMGDNRDNSEDSRFDPGLPPEDPKLGGCGWDSQLDSAVGAETGVGFVPEDNLVGKAQIVMLSWHENASILKPWTWFDLRTDRFLRLLK
ncbi:MAG: signal peptidase I [Pseudomonadota bacterium]|nr:signal peptidase I [Pseudomonadota bacterium]